MMARPRRGIEMGVLLLLWQFLNTGVTEYLPPVTSIVIAGQVGLYMGLIPVSWNAADVCLSAQAVLRWREHKRLLLSCFEHGDDIHLYYNMLSLLAKGRQLERHFGSPYFIYLLGVFSILTSVVYVGLQVLLSEILDDRQYYKTCAIGFSGVLFALKVLTTQYWETGYRRYFGIRISAKYAVWMELVMIQILVPNASFIGHLAGILVGILYTQGLLKIIMDFPIMAFSLFNRSSSANYLNRQTAWGSGVSGYSANFQSAGNNENISDGEYDEAVRRSYETLQEQESFVDRNLPPVDPEEIRRRRIARFAD